MIKISKSKIHSYPVVFFFADSASGDNGTEYLIPESPLLFSSENFASTLVEISGSAKEADTFLAKEGKKIAASCQADFEKRVTLVEFRKSGRLASSDFVMEYQEGSLPPITVKAIVDMFQKTLRFKIKVKKTKFKQSFLASDELKPFHRVRITVAAAFVKKGSKKLSKRFLNSFSDKYTDSQVPFIVLAPIFSGTAGKK